MIVLERVKIKRHGSPTLQGIYCRAVASRKFENKKKKVKRGSEINQRASKNIQAPGWCVVKDTSLDFQKLNHLL